jgi:hypothetical protein
MKSNDAKGALYEVRVQQVGSGFWVYPGRSVIRVQNWARYSVEWPNNEKRLRRSIERCQAWCDKRNAEEAAACQTLAKVVGG